MPIELEGRVAGTETLGVFDRKLYGTRFGQPVPLQVR